VALLTLIGPVAPCEAPPTEIPGPKFATVLPWKKLLKDPVIVTVRLWPGAPMAELRTIAAGGLIVTDEALLLAKLTPVEVVPDRVTLYAVGAFT
jgi:hypothetical protein